MSCALIGCLIGAVSSGALSNRFGRKRLLTLAALVFAVSSLGTGLAPHFAAFVVWRMLGRLCHRSCVWHLADVHCGDFAGASARPACLAEPVGHRLWNSAGASGELADRAAGAAGRIGAGNSLCRGTASGDGAGCLPLPRFLRLSFWWLRCWCPRARDGWLRRAAMQQALRSARAPRWACLCATQVMKDFSHYPREAQRKRSLLRNCLRRAWPRFFCSVLCSLFSSSGAASM